MEHGVGSDLGGNPVKGSRSGCTRLGRKRGSGLSPLTWEPDVGLRAAATQVPGINTSSCKQGVVEASA